MVLADTLDAMTPDWDAIVDCARGGSRPGSLHDVEELAQHFADRLVRAVRGKGARRPSAAPLLITPTGAIW